MNMTSGITLLPNETDYYSRRELKGCGDSTFSVNSVQTTTKPIHTTNSNAIHLNGTQNNKGRKKLVKPYAVVDVKDIETDGRLETSQEVLGRYSRAKHQRHTEVPSNREALEKSFALNSDNITISTEVEQPTSPGRYYTVPMYVNINVPMTVNPSYNKNKV